MTHSRNLLLIFSAIAAERRAPPPPAQLPLPQPAPAASLPAAAHQQPHAGVAERGPAHPAPPPGPPQGPARRRIPVAHSSATFPQPAAAAAIVPTGPGLELCMFWLRHQIYESSTDSYTRLGCQRLYSYFTFIWKIIS